MDIAAPAVPNITTEEELWRELDRIDMVLQLAPEVFNSGIFGDDLERVAMRQMEVTITNAVEAANRLGLTETVGIPDDWHTGLTDEQIEERITERHATFTRP